MAENIEVRFVPNGRGKAQCPPNPKYPDGIDIDASVRFLPSCMVSIPYPAPECGHWEIGCKECNQTILVTAAGRPDDPKSARIRCQKTWQG